MVCTSFSFSIVSGSVVGLWTAAGCVTIASIASVTLAKRGTVLRWGGVGLGWGVYVDFGASTWSAEFLVLHALHKGTDLLLEPLYSLANAEVLCPLFDFQFYPYLRHY